VNQRGDLKVSDFGISRSLSDSVSMLTMERGRSGTLVFMSPQQLDGERGTPLDDVYSFGATMYELITSKPPFSSGNVDRQIREKIPPTMAARRKDLEIEGEMMDETWEKVIAACLAKDPERRPQSFVDIAQRLEIASPKTVRAERALQPPTTATASAPPIPAPATATSTTLPPIPKPGGLSPAKLALIIGGAAALLLFFLGAIGVWYFVFHKPAAAKTVAMQKSTTAPQQPPASNTDRSSGMADKAKDMNLFKNTNRPQPSVAPNNPPSAPTTQNPPSAPNAQPVVPLNDFTGG
jgi:serine/threonine protein kinase